ncbi:MAG: type II CAAX endopeptidase family protein [Oscillospiraceae bacterium]
MYNNYGQNSNQPPMGNNYPPYGYQNPYGAAEYFQREKEKTTLKKISKIVGLAVIFFTVLNHIIPMLLAIIPKFISTYKASDIFALSIDIIFGMVVILIPFLVGYFVLKKDKKIKVLPLGTPYNYSAFFLLIFAGLMICMLGSYATGIFSGVVENLFGIRFTQPEDNTKLTSVAVIILYIVRAAFIPALIEEFAIRGVVMQPLRKYGDMFAIIMSSFVFSIMHGNMVQIPFAFIAGIAIGYAVITTGSMWTGIIIHFLNNLCSVIMQVMMDNLGENKAAIFTSLMVLSIVIIGAVCAFCYYRKFSRVPLSKGISILSKSEKTQSFTLSAPMIIAFAFLVIQTAQYVEFNG